MKKLISLSVVAWMLLLFISCASVDRDAREAARLNKESMEYAKEGDLEEAERAYKDAQQIISDYKDTEYNEEFHAAYNKYMLQKDDL